MDSAPPQETVDLTPPTPPDAVEAPRPSIQLPPMPSTLTSVREYVSIREEQLRVAMLGGAVFDRDLRETRAQLQAAQARADALETELRTATTGLQTAARTVLAYNTEVEELRRRVGAPPAQPQPSVEQLQARLAKAQRRAERAEAEAARAREIEATLAGRRREQDARERLLDAHQLALERHTAERALAGLDAPREPRAPAPAEDTDDDDRLSITSAASVSEFVAEDAARDPNWPPKTQKKAVVGKGCKQPRSADPQAAPAAKKSRAPPRYLNSTKIVYAPDGSIVSPLPLRLDADGMIKCQYRAGVDEPFCDRRHAWARSGPMGTVFYCGRGSGHNAVRELVAWREHAAGDGDRDKQAPAPVGAESPPPS
jgi:hypothetical protein